MKFTALPVNYGDSFLLEDDGKVILVDGGASQIRILELLDNKVKNNQIDICVCTHYDADHYEGIAAVAKSGKYSIGEIWLPEIVGSIAYTIRARVLKELEPLRLPNEEEIAMFAHNIDCQEQIIKTQEVSDEDAEMQFIGRANWEFYDSINYKSIRDLAMGKIFYQMIMLPKLVSNLYQSGARIRWLKYEPRYKEIAFNGNVNLFGINCKETALTKHISVMSLMFAAYLSPINKHSLNFKYQRKHVPDVLFTADSDLSYMGRKVIPLQANSIVTAPHHGAASASAAYGRIQLNNNPYFVRSDRASTSRPCKEYTSQKNIFCTVCRDETKKQEVRFEFDSMTAKFNIFGNPCTCP